LSATLLAPSFPWWAGYVLWLIDLMTWVAEHLALAERGSSRWAA
jgi:hypothetical protein